MRCMFAGYFKVKLGQLVPLRFSPISCSGMRTFGDVVQGFYGQDHPANSVKALKASVRKHIMFFITASRKQICLMMSPF